MANIGGLAGSMILSAALLGAGCAQSPAPVEEEQRVEFRRTVETAPADLQLTCAAEAVEELGLPSNRVLPLASAVEEPGLYSVMLNTDGTRTLCRIDSDGNVQSLEETGPVEAA